MFFASSRLERFTSRCTYRLQQCLLLGLLCLIPWVCASQTIYGSYISSSQLYSVNPTTGAVSRICGTTTLPFSSNAIGVSNFQNGLIYFIESAFASTPSISSLDPVTCLTTTRIVTTLPYNIVRATACPDGRLYAMGAFQDTVFEISPTTGATGRTLTFTGLPTGGSGDFACDSNGVMYILAEAGGVARLYSAASAAFQSVPSGSDVAITNIGPLGSTITPNGLSEAPTGLAGCAAAPAPCLIANVNISGGSNTIWSVNSTTGLATSLTSTTVGLTDLARNFPLDVSLNKSASRTEVAQGGTLTYTIVATNNGPGVAGRINVIDNFSTGAYSTVTWVCAVIAAGSSTMVTTACGAASGVGNINQTASLSINGQIRYTISAALSNTFTGTLTNVGNATLSANFFDPTPTNNLSTVTVKVIPAAALGVSKTNGITTTFAGSTVNYTVTFTNGGPGAADGARIQDIPSAGLAGCAVVSCAPEGGSACPGTPNSLFSPSSTTIPTFPANSTLTLLIRCQVSATGM